MMTPLRGVCNFVDGIKIEGLEFRVMRRKLFEHSIVQRIEGIRCDHKNNTQRTAQCKAQEVAVDDAGMFGRFAKQNVVN